MTNYYQLGDYQNNPLVFVLHTTFQF